MTDFVREFEVMKSIEIDIHREFGYFLKAVEDDDELKQLVVESEYIAIAEGDLYADYVKKLADNYVWCYKFLSKSFNMGYTHEIVFNNVSNWLNGMEG